MVPQETAAALACRQASYESLQTHLKTILTDDSGTARVTALERMYQTERRMRVTAESTLDAHETTLQSLRGEVARLQGQVGSCNPSPTIFQDYIQKNERDEEEDGRSGGKNGMLKSKHLTLQSLRGRWLLCKTRKRRVSLSRGPISTVAVFKVIDFRYSLVPRQLRN
jgi:hypothetical protein